MAMGTTITMVMMARSIRKSKFWDLGRDEGCCFEEVMRAEPRVWNEALL